MAVVYHLAFVVRVLGTTHKVQALSGIISRYAKFG